MFRSKPGYFGSYGGCYVAETLMDPMQELAKIYAFYEKDKRFQEELSALLRDYVGRPTALTYAGRLSEYCQGAQIYLKREDLAHTGAHKINNVIGQALLAKKMGKKRIIAETGAGQHGVATATVCAMMDLDCTIYMGEVDMERQALNVKRMRLLGAHVKGVALGTRTLKDAVSEALRAWVASVDSYYLLGSVVGPHPYPTMVRNFQKIIGIEAREQILKMTGKLPDEIVACIGGGSNSMGLFYPFLADKSVKMTGVEAGGCGPETGRHAARFEGGSVGVFQGMKTFLLQDEHGQIQETHSISAGLDYSGIGPEHAYLREEGRVRYVYSKDEEALNAARLVSRLEGIIPALESAHALAYALREASHLPKNYCMIINVSGRGDKDIETLTGEIS